LQQARIVCGNHKNNLNQSWRCLCLRWRRRLLRSRCPLAVQ